MRRKQGTLIPIENSIIEVASKLQRQGINKFYGFQIAKDIKGRDAHLLTSNGTLYRALGRLEKLGILQSRWEKLLTESHRPRRRLYHLVGDKNES
jgi:PadR family transcriptional regulator PadR